tara:strand:+ start:751 stop:1008 length:258 start_codon:yes stop_codon:yes gene_type:complete
MVEYLEIINGQYNKRYEYNYKMPSYGIGAEHIYWCEQNVTNPWGWWFKREEPYIVEPHKDDRAFVSFTVREDHAKFTWYMLSTKE